MLSTIIMFAILIGGLIASAVLWAVFLRLGLRWAKVEGVTTGRIVLATVAVVGMEVALNLLLRAPSPTGTVAILLVAVAGFATTLLAQWFVIMLVFKTGFFRAAQAWLPTLLSAAVALLFVFLVLRPFIFEAFVSPTNAMAPTLLGNRWQGVCPECDQPNFCSPPTNDYYGTPIPAQRICGNFHVSQDGDAAPCTTPADRFLVAKYLTPQRWDVVVFRFPEDPSTNYVMRLVGLPGEEITIQDGTVWADGKELATPESLRGVEYLSTLPNLPMKLWGSPDCPAKLGDDEYFVLGDFSAQSRDSRLWERGAAGNHPFAVPASNMCGVVTHIYWPPDRWRILR